MAPEKPSLEETQGIAIGHVLSFSSIQLKEADGALTEEHIRGEDDDLTSLSWLVQNKNLLKGINLKPGAAQTSPTSDFAEDGSSGSDRSEREEGEGEGEGEGSTCSSGSDPHQHPPPPPHQGRPACACASVAPDSPSKLKHPHHIPYDPLVHINSKPPYSFSCLIFMAIEDSPARALPVKEIYAWIQSHFPFYRNAPTGWKNSVRHNLSLNKCFCKVEKAPNLGKGSLWMVDPAFRPNLLQSMSKAPVNSLSFLDRSSANVVSSGSDLKSNGGLLRPMPGSKTGGKLSHLPNPELFPFLSRRLAASGVELPLPGISRGVDADADSEEDDDADDVDAAAAMLTLKHGPRVILPKNDDLYKRLYSRQGTRKSSIATPVITNSPSEDHTYSAGPNMSPDEAYGEGSDTDEGTEITPDHANYREEALQLQEEQEQRRIAEGAADALLNLAGFRSKQTLNLETNRARQRTRRLGADPPAKRARRLRQPSDGSDTPRPQQLRSNRKRLEQDIMDRRTLMKAEIMADLEVIRNNNNIVSDEELSKGAAISPSSQPRRQKLKEKRKYLGSTKQSLHINHLTKMELSSARQAILDKKSSVPQKRKHWSLGENSLRKARR